MVLFCDKHQISFAHYGKIILVKFAFIVLLVVFLHFLTIQVTPDVHFQKDLGLDSLDNVEIVMALEEEFKLEIPDKEAVRIDACNLAIEYIYNHPMAS